MAELGRPITLDGRPFTDPRELLAAVFAVLPTESLGPLEMMRLVRRELQSRTDGLPARRMPPWWCRRCGTAGESVPAACEACGEPAGPRNGTR
jgi:hypothetical protein